MTGPGARFASVLVANRGEIALRVMRSARTMGLRCIAVHTEADAGAPHVAFADRAVCIGAGPAAESYLSIPALLAAARETGAEAVHPGYGFLSESAEFAAACRAAGLVFVGPSAEAIALMGDKAAARTRMQAAGVPCLPGYSGADQSDAALAAAAGEIGFPVMIKPAAGGGGRGMRLVPDADAFPEALRAARSEARRGFGAERMVLEQALADVRHVEIQILADRHGAVLHLGERDCSVQRRHQKIVEEAPSPAVSDALRARMGAVAAQAARAVGYVGAGTVEFLLAGDGAFHFLEMNTRLQVEHPVTEMVTGLDLVALQFRIAQGDALELAQGDIAFAGHAIEARLYAEDPARDFLPQSGRLLRWRPGRGEGLRIDAGVAEGQVLAPYYDPLLAKLIAHGATREEARGRLIAALGDTAVFGVASNRDVLIDILSHPRFAAARVSTGFLAETYAGGFAADPDAADWAIAAALVFRDAQARAAAASPGVAAELMGWSSTGQLQSSIVLRHERRAQTARLTLGPDGALHVAVAGTGVTATGLGGALRLGGVRADIRAWFCTGETIHFATGTRTRHFGIGTEAARRDAGDETGAIAAPMPGQVVEIAVRPGERVGRGDRLAVLEAMKLQHVLAAPCAGRIASVAVVPGDQVGSGAILIRIEPEEAAG